MLGAGFTVFVTMDRNLSYQQNVAAAGVAVIVLRGRTNRWQDLIVLMPALRKTIEIVPPGQVIEVTR